MVFDLPAATFEKLLQLGRVTGSVVFAVQLQPDATARREMLCQIIEKEFPFGDSPQAWLLVIVKANHECGNEVEFFAEIGQGNEWLNAPGHTRHAEQSCDVAEHRHLIDVEADGVVAEQPRDVGEVAGAAAEIENAFWRGSIEIDSTHPANVDADPTVEIEIFGPILAGIIDRVSPSNLVELVAIDGLNYALGLEWKSRRMQGSAQMTPRAGEALAGKEFF